MRVIQTDIHVDHIENSRLTRIVCAYEQVESRLEMKSLALQKGLVVLNGNGFNMHL